MPYCEGLFLLLILTLALPAWAETALCKRVILHGSWELEFNSTEKRMLCGDPKVKAYKVIPPYEARVFMTGFLQSRGHLTPSFEIKDGVLHVHPGKPTEIKEIHVHTGEEKERKFVKDEILRLYKGKTLTPKTMDAIEGAALSVVRRRGFPCADVESEAFTDESAVDLSFKKLSFHPFGEVMEEEIPGLHENALKRMRPFRPRDPFNERLLRLEEKRLLRSEVVSGTYFLEECGPEGETFSLSQRFILGPPRSFRYGAGANTEVGPLVRVKWSNNRFGPMASQLSATLQLSFRVQSLNLTSDQFFWFEHPRRSLFSQLDLFRESQLDYYQSVGRLRPHMKWTEDKLKRHWTYTLGPTFEAGAYRFDENLDTKYYKNLGVEGSFAWMSHVYEYYDILPQEGDSFKFSFDYRDPKLGFDSTLLKLDSTLAFLSRMGTWERGELIGGVRVLGGTTFVPADVSLISLPPNVKFYGGGSDDIRGFLLQTLPKNDGLGALSKVGLKLELRRTYLVKESFEGFLFLDGARFGEEPWILERRVWYSPGLGLRWYSPIGMVQAYWARALASHPHEDLGDFYFLGLGGSF